MNFEEVMADELGKDARLDEVIDDAGIDSLSYLQFILRCENEFSVKLKDEEVNKLRTFRDLGALIDRLKAHA